MMYKFLGKPDWKFPHLVTGEVYDLVISRIEAGKTLVGDSEVAIIKPFYCPYNTEELFKENWERVK